MRRPRDDEESTEMPPRAPLPADDLYARLGVPRYASPEAIDLAWRALLRKHHPDVAGPDALELAKRINVAHDWLSDPDLRRRYDLERPAGRPTRHASGTGTDADIARSTTRRGVARPPTTAERVAAIIERTGRLTRDELDRLALAEPAPIAFLATLRRFVTAELDADLDRAERAALAALPPTERRRPAIHDAIVGRLADLILADVLDELLGDPAGSRARERLTRGWDSAVGQPRYGPATATVEAFLERLRGLGVTEERALARTAAGADAAGDPPWPVGTSADDDDALRVSSELAAHDAERALDGHGRAVPAGARRAVARIAHLLVLRHAFPPAAFERLAAPWLGEYIDRRDTPEPVVRRRRA